MLSRITACHRRRYTFHLAGGLQKYQPLSLIQKAPGNVVLASRWSTSNTTANRTKDGTLWYAVAGGFLVTIAGSLKYMHDEVGSLEGLWRSVSFYSVAIPSYFEYRYHLWRESPNDVWEELDHRTSEKGLDKIMELKGFYIKAGQMCASNIGNAFPIIWQDTMAILQDQVPHLSGDAVRAIIQNELDFQSVFASFDDEPIGAASIGQVHRATLQDGTPVVVKVRYPDSERLLKGDVRTIKLFAQVAQPVHVPPLEEIERQFQTEFDYRQEGQQLDDVRNNLTKAGLAGPGKLCRVPKPYLHLCTTNVLVMEELVGEKLAVGLKRNMESLATQLGTTVDQLIQSHQQEHQTAKIEKERMGPSAATYDKMIAALDYQRRLQNAGRLLHNIALSWIPGVNSKSYQNKSMLPINHAKLVDDLIYIHGHEVLVDGCFNGDPHPGNIMLLQNEDGSPQLGLIDYGQVKRLTKLQRHLLCHLIIALAENDTENIIRVMTLAGFKSKDMNPNVIDIYAKLCYDQDNHEMTNGMHVQMFMEELQSRDPILEVPEDYVMVSRASLMLRGLAHALHQHRSVAESWKPIAERVLQNNI